MSPSLCRSVCRCLSVGVLWAAVLSSLTLGDLHEAVLWRFCVFFSVSLVGFSPDFTWSCVAHQDFDTGLGKAIVDPLLGKTTHVFTKLDVLAKVGRPSWRWCWLMLVLVVLLALVLTLMLTLTLVVVALVIVAFCCWRSLLRAFPSQRPPLASSSGALAAVYLHCNPCAFG